MRPDLQFALIFGGFTWVCGVLIGTWLRASVNRRRLSREYSRGLYDGRAEGLSEAARYVRNAKTFGRSEGIR